MITIRHSDQRGRTTVDWLNGYHSFSFADFHDRNWERFGSLRVINEDFIEPGRGFAMHSHHNMEILTYVISGSLIHHDNLGNSSIIQPGEIQRMSAGHGVRHSEFNHSKQTKLHLLQIWVQPDTVNIEPSYEQKTIAKQMNHLVLIGAPTSTPHTVLIHQNLLVYAGYFQQNSHLSHPLQGQQGWLQLIKGSIECNGALLSPGDGIALHNEPQIVIHCLNDAEFLLFDMG